MNVQTNIWQHVIWAVSLVLLTVSDACFAENSKSKAQSGNVRVIPDDLYRYAEGQGCSQVSSFYRERPEVREPPYVYGVLAPNAEVARQDFSFAFWCEQMERGARKYVLLLNLDGRAWPGGCTSRIEGQDFAGGLSVIRDLKEPLDWYWNMQDKKKLGRPGQMTAGPGIRSLYDGTGNIFYCHEGKWLARPLE